MNHDTPIWVSLHCELASLKLSSLQMAGSWATVAAIEAEQPICSDKGSLADVLPKSKCAVLDASAIIGAESLRNHPGTLYTTPEVYSEVHDKHSQQVLASLPAGIVEQEPTASSISAGRHLFPMLVSLQKG